MSFYSRNFPNNDNARPDDTGDDDRYNSSDDGGGVSDDYFYDDYDDDDALDSGCESSSGGGLEMEPLTRSSERGVRSNNNDNVDRSQRPLRTSSGTLLYRALRTTSNASSSSTSNATTPAKICRSRGATFVRAAYSRWTQPRQSSESSNNSNSTYPRRGGGNLFWRTYGSSSPILSRNRICCWILCFVGMILMSISLNLFEESYVMMKPEQHNKATTIDDNNNHSNSDSSAGANAAPALAPLDKSQPTTTNTGSKPMGQKTNRKPNAPPPPQQIRKPRTTKAPTVPTPKLSVFEHQTLIQDPEMAKTALTTNSFTTWLDFNDDNNNNVPSRKKYNPTNGSIFASQWCDLTGTTWYPRKSTSPNDAKDMTWQLRAPAFIIPGAAYSGTRYMAAALHQHPLILPARTKELQFFHGQPFRRYIHANTTHVALARAHMYALDYDVYRLKQNASFVSFDATPGYLFYSSSLPLRILCVEPWIKMVLLLRNPVDLVLEHYAAEQQKGLKQSLEEWIEQEWTLMRSVGLIPDANNNNATRESSSSKFYGSTEEDVAWDRYSTATLTGGVGRSIYVIQIRHWINAFKLAGRDPADAILVVRTDRLALDPDAEYTRVLEFLHLPLHTLQHKLLPMPIPISHQTRPISSSTRKQLESFFRPYNRRLLRLLQDNGISSSSSTSSITGENT